MSQNSTRKKAMLVALRESLGIVTDASKIAGIERTSHYHWLKTDPDYKKAVDELVDIPLDFAESELHKRIKAGDTTAIIFFLKTKGKSRGYIERQEIEHEFGTKPLKIGFVDDDGSSI